MEKNTRMDILKMTIAVRQRLEEDILAQLEGTYGMNRDGHFEPAESMPTLKKNPVLTQHRHDLEAAVAHERARGGNQSNSEALVRFAREVAFTYLNRLAALRMMEARELIQPSIGAGLESSGFKTFQLAFKTITPSAEDGYRLYLELLFDEAAVELPALFDRSHPSSILFPSPQALKDVLNQLNQSALSGIWIEDETIGWIYQYFTPKAQREQARKESQAPRNSYELSFRNQFYTPAYVVHFLTDNTLGRLWYEMKQGHTRLAETCEYLVWRPDEELPEREWKSPEEFRVLDPACGSGHFLLYAFDLLALMYEEEGYAHEDIPGFILEKNLFGIDIDERATQITSLALFLKAKKYDRQAHVTRTNIVCAEPMPGDEELFKEFMATLNSPTLERIARAVWRELELASEAGSLLKVETAIADAVANEREAWVKKVRTSGGQKALQLTSDFADARDPDFWEKAESRLQELLREYAAKATNGATTSRRLFARDGEQGIRFIDVMQQMYDVVLMNPPFGDASKPSKAYIEKTYPRTKNDIYAAFVERGLGLLHRGGMLGAITSRTGFFLSSFQRWREEILLKEARPTVVADLGQGVLDTAMVETAAYCLEAR